MPSNWPIYPDRADFELAQARLAILESAAFLKQFAPDLLKQYPALDILGESHEQ